MNLIMQNDIYSFLGLIKKAGKLSSGDEVVEMDIKKKKCLLLIIAEDSSENTKDRFKGLADKHNINYVNFGLKADLGSHIGKGLTSVISIKDEGFAKAFLNKVNHNINGGDDIVKI